MDTGRTGKIPGWMWWVAALAAAVVLTLGAEGFPHGESKGGANQSICNIEKRNGITPPPSAGC